MQSPSNRRIVSGKSGTGKSTLTDVIEADLSQQYIYVQRINCKSIKGKSFESLQKLLLPLLTKLIYFQPSVLIIDDIHVLCEKVSDVDEPTQESLYFNKYVYS